MSAVNTHHPNHAHADATDELIPHMQSTMRSMLTPSALYMGLSGTR